MGREVRRVPADWRHPKTETFDHRGQWVERYKRLLPGERYQSEVDRWDNECARWKAGWRPDYAGEDAASLVYEQWAGQRPHRDDYMPTWPESERTHLMMYEDTTEGTPISPAFETPEDLARWLADNKASWFGGEPDGYDDWIQIARGGWKPDMALTLPSPPAAQGSKEPQS